METYADMEAQFGSLIDLTPEELERVCAATLKTSTPKPAPVTTHGMNDSGIASLTTAIESLVTLIGTQNRTLNERMSKLEEKVLKFEDRSRQKEVQVDDKDELMAALEEIESQVKTAHDKRSPKKPSMKPPQYDGRSSWEDYQAQFNIIADLNQWDSVTSATFLAVSLSGPAREVLGDLDPTERTSLPALKKALATRFGTENSRETYRTSLRTRIRRKDETLQELAQAIRRLTRQAYPQVPADVREDLAKDKFIDTLTDFDTKWKVKQTRPSTLNNALEVAVELEALQQATTKTTPMTRTVRKSEDNGLAKQLQELKRRLNKLESEKKRRDVCFCCGAPDHFRRDCPTAPRRQQQRRRNTTHNPQGEPRQQQGRQPAPMNIHKPSRDNNLSSQRAVEDTPIQPSVKSGQVDNCVDELFVEGRVQGTPVKFLIDTGSNITILKTSVWEQLSTPPDLESVTVQMKLADGTTSPFAGRGEFDVQLGGDRATRVLWVADIEPDGILGLDVMRAVGVELLLRGGSYEVSFRSRQEETTTSDQEPQPYCRRVTVNSTMVVPPQSGVIIPGKLVNGGQVTGMEVIEPTEQLLRTNQPLLAEAVVDTGSPTIPLRLMNPTDEPRKVNRNTVVSVCEPVSELIDESPLVATCKLGTSTETDRQKRHYDHRGVKTNVFSYGDPVWLFNPKRKKGLSPKLQNDVYEGPFLVVKRLDDLTYRIQKGIKSKPKVVHHNRLKPYEGENALKWLKKSSTDSKKETEKNNEEKREEQTPVTEKSSTKPDKDPEKKKEGQKPTKEPDVQQKTPTRPTRQKKQPAWMKHFVMNTS